LTAADSHITKPSSSMVGTRALDVDGDVDMLVGNVRFLLGGKAN